jgi:pyridinium-3,5-bisthiocarboxylic acid mononucleotide nickel chelatase
MRCVYFDCFAGVSGDMTIGAQLDLGVDFEALKQQLASLGLAGYQINSRRVERNGISAAKFDVDVEQQEQPARSFADIRSIIQASGLSETTRLRSIAAFERLAIVEARVHGTTPDKVHFHEVGAVDSIVDIVGAMIGFELLGVDRCFCSSLRVGSGLIDSEHGRLPVPAPATVELLQGVPIYAGELEGEFVTPTGAAIVATLCAEFGALPQMSITKVGYGAGSRDPKGFPNVLRLMLGEIDEAEDPGSPAGVATRPHQDTDPLEVPGLGTAAQTRVDATSDETIVVIETNIDDMNPQVYGFVMERAFALGALDAFMVSAQMKKDRPGVLVSVLCKPERAEAILEMLLAETTTLGVRYYEARRRVLERAIEEIETPYGTVRIKVARDGARTLHFQPEYDDCARLAVATNNPLLEVQAAASAAYRKKLKQLDRTNGQDVELKEGN